MVVSPRELARDLFVVTRGDVAYPPLEQNYRFGDIRVGVRGERVTVVGETLESSSDAALVLLGEVYNGPEIARRLGEPPPTDRRGDAQMLLRAWQRWGDQVFDLVDGECAGAVVSNRSDRVRVFRDITAGEPLYVWSSLDAAAASSDLATVVACQPTVRPNPLFIAEYLQNQFLDASATPFDGIRAVQPGHVSVLNSNGWQSRRVARWHVKPIRRGNLDDYVDEFQHLLDNAMRRRLSGAPVAAVSLSGGLDSTNVLASGAAVGSDVRWVAYSIRFRTVRGDETRLQQLVAEHCGAELRWVPVDGRGPVGLPGPLFGGRPAPPWAGNWFFGEGLAQAAAEDGIRLLFDGEDADSLLTGGRGYLSDLLIRGRWASLRSVVRRLRQETGRRSSGLLKEAVAGLLPPALARRLLPTPGSQLISAVVSPELARNVGLAARLRAQPQSSIWSPGRRFMAQQMLAGMPAQLGTVAAEVGAPFRTRDVSGAHPFFDRQLMTFCMGLPWQAVHDVSTPKLLLRELAKRRLPAEFNRAVRKADLSEYYDAAVFGHERTTIDRGLDLAATRPDLVNPDAVARLRNELHQHADSWMPSRVAMLMLWLESLGETQD